MSAGGGMTPIYLLRVAHFSTLRVCFEKEPAQALSSATQPPLTVLLPHSFTSYLTPSLLLSSLAQHEIGLSDPLVHLALSRDMFFAGIDKTCTKTFGSGPTQISITVAVNVTQVYIQRTLK